MQNPRLKPVSPVDAPARTKTAFDRVGVFAAASNPVLGTLLWHPELAEAYMPFSDYMKNRGLLAAHHRRLAILRTAWNCGADYQWVAHAGYARAADVPDEVIERVGVGPLSPLWDEVERATLRAVDELHLDGMISEDTWVRLAEHLEPPQLIELTMLVGNYEMIAMIMNSVGILPDEQAPDLPGNKFRAHQA